MIKVAAFAESYRVYRKWLVNLHITKEIFLIIRLIVVMNLSFSFNHRYLYNNTEYYTRKYGFFKAS